MIVTAISPIAAALNDTFGPEQSATGPALVSRVVNDFLVVV